MSVSLTRAGTFARAGLSKEAVQRMDKAGSLFETTGLLEQVRLWTASEIDRLRQSLENGAHSINANCGIG